MEVEPWGVVTSEPWVWEPAEEANEDEVDFDAWDYANASVPDE